MKRKIKLSIIFIGIALFIPSFLAIYLYSFARSSPVRDNAVFKLELSDPDSQLFTFTRPVVSDTKDKNDDQKKIETVLGDDPISFFIRMNKNASAVTELPEPLRDVPHYTAKYYSYDMETEYRYYFSNNSMDAYYTDNKGHAFRIRQDDAEKFISSPYAICLYKSGAAPVLNIAGSTVITPSDILWKYKLTNSTYTDAVVETTGKQLSYALSGPFMLNFTVEPDYLFVKISRGEEILFEDIYSNAAPFSYGENAQLTVDIKAQWFENDQRGSYGEASYTFIADVHSPAEFYLGKPEIEEGEFVVITGKNVLDVNNIQFSSSPDIEFTPTFFQEGNYVYALVPIYMELAYSPSYTFTINCDNTTSELTLNVKQKKERWSDYNISADIVAATRTTATVNAFNETMQPYWDAKETTRYWNFNELFGEPLPNSPQVRVGFGLYRTISSTGTTYRQNGIEYMVGADTDVLAVAKGKVVYTGSTAFSGKTVVIEHGFGLKTFYWHMSNTSVSVGDLVETGAVLGKTGSTGFTSGDNLHFGMYIFDVPVCPYMVWPWWEGASGIPVYTP